MTEGLSRRDGSLREIMDDPDCDPVRLRRTLRRFRVVNALVTGWPTVYRRHVRSVLNTRTGPVRILDIGCGSGDVLRRLVMRARADGFDASGLGIDPDPRSLSAARRAAPVDGVGFRLADSATLVGEGDAYDVVVSNHVLHHLSDAALSDVVADSATLSTGVALHSDIARSRLAYAAYTVGVTPIAPGTFLRTDGLRSIRRSWTQAELADVLPAGWTVESPVPFRLLAVRHAG